MQSQVPTSSDEDRTGQWRRGSHRWKEGLEVRGHRQRLSGATARGERAAADADALAEEKPRPPARRAPRPPSVRPSLLPMGLTLSPRR